jgi:hypothetical protein
MTAWTAGFLRTCRSRLVQPRQSLIREGIGIAQSCAVTQMLHVARCGDGGDAIAPEENAIGVGVSLVGEGEAAVGGNIGGLDGLRERRQGGAKKKKKIRTRACGFCLQRQTLAVRRTVKV